MAPGFRTSEQKLAFHRGDIEAVAGFPVDILNVLRGEFAGHGGGGDSHGGVGYGGAGGNRSGPGTLMLTAARRSSNAFSTDRGRLTLEAWEVRAREVAEPIWVLDPAIVRRTWRPSGSHVREWVGTTAELGPDERTVTMAFTGGSPAWTDYLSAEVLVSAAAVAIIPVESRATVAANAEDGLRGNRSRAFSLVGFPRQVTVTLARPLGKRVLLDDVGGPVMVSGAGNP